MYEAKELDECHSWFFAEICKSECSLLMQYNQTVTPACQRVVHHFHGCQVTWNYGAGVFQRSSN